MHRNAKRWDEQNPDTRAVNRPCDWCGKIVKTGMIHQKCLKIERRFYLQICIDGGTDIVRPQ